MTLGNSMRSMFHAGKAAAGRVATKTYGLCRQSHPMLADPTILGYDYVWGRAVHFIGVFVSATPCAPNEQKPGNLPDALASP